MGATGYSPAPCTEALSPSQTDSTPYPGANIQNALKSAPSGAVICLREGDYDTTSQIDLYQITPASNVTLEPAPGAEVHLGWLNIGNDVQNLTVQGLYLNGGASTTGAHTNLVFVHNTISGGGMGFYFYGNGQQQSGISILDNQMDHLAPANLAPTGAGQCVTVAGGRATEHDFTVEGNVCGPGIGNHYTQFGGIDGLVEDRNTFLGPAAAEALSTQQHNNVLQIFGNADNVDFSNNIIWETDSRGQTVLIEEGAFSNVTVHNNLWREDPACLSNSNCFSYAFAACATNGLSFTNNTVVDSYWGVQITNSVVTRSDGTATGCAATGSDYTVTHNIVVGASGGPDIHYGECSATCTYDYNVTSDQTGRSGNAVVDWMPQWQDTLAYQPLGLPFAAGSDL